MMRLLLTALMSVCLVVVSAPMTSAQAPATDAPLSVAKVRTLLKEAGACEVMHSSRCAPLKTLVERGTSSTKALLSSLSSGIPGVRAAAAATLGQLRVAISGEPLLALLDDKDSRVVHAAITAVGRIKPAGGINALKTALASEDSSIAVAAAYALGSTRSANAVPALLAALQHEKARVRASAARSLGTIASPRATMGLATFLADPSTRWPAREAAARSLGLIKSPDGVPMLLLMLADREARVRLAAIESLGLIGDSRALKGLSILLQDPEFGRSAADALGRIKSSDALPALIRVLKARKAPLPIIERSFWAIGEIAANSSSGVLLPFLKDEDPQFAVWAADALGRIGDLQSREELFEALKRDEPEVKEMAAWALQKLSGYNLGLDVKRWESWVYSEDSFE
jgi:HEAT repeat protein